MLVSTWKGGTYGIRVGKENALRYFDKSWENIYVKIGGQFYTFNLSSTFWTTCPEFRGGHIPVWLRKNNLHTWPKGRPHRLILKPLDGNHFELMFREYTDK